MKSSLLLSTFLFFPSIAFADDLQMDKKTIAAVTYEFTLNASHTSDSVARGQIQYRCFMHQVHTEGLHQDLSILSKNKIHCDYLSELEKYECHAQCQYDLRRRKRRRDYWEE